MPESPTTARPLDLDDDEGQETGVVSDTPKGAAGNNNVGGAGQGSSDTPTAPVPAQVTDADADEAAPPKPPRPLTEAQKNELILKEAFPSVQPGVIKAVLRASQGQVEPAFHALLEMTDPDAAKADEEAEVPPPQPPRPSQGAGGLSQLEADEQYARQLAEHYERTGSHDAPRAHARQPAHHRQGRTTDPGLKPNHLYDDRDHSFIDDDLPVIRDSLRKGFLETQTKVNSWITTFKKRLDDAFDEEEAAQQQKQNNIAYGGRRPGDPSSRRSEDYDRYDADPQVITDDFAGMRLAADGTPIRDAAPAANQDLFRPPPPSKSPKPNDGRRVAFKEHAEDIDAYNSSPKLNARSSTLPGNKQSKWQPLSSVDPNPIADNDPFSLGDSEDEREVKDKGTGSGAAAAAGSDVKGDDAERLRKAAAEAMADSLVEEKKGEAGSKTSKFGKHIQKRQLEVPEYSASFVNYKALKKLIKKLSATPTLGTINDSQRAPTPLDSQSALQANKATFFFQLERELEKVNAFYLQKEAELKVRLKTLLDKKKSLQSRPIGSSRRSAKFAALEEGFQQFASDLNKLQQFVEVNGTAFSKILKKWDKTSKSKTKELYLSRAVEVQPFFNPTVISELSDQATTSLQDLGAWAEGDHVGFESRQEHVVTSQHIPGTDDGDVDFILLDTTVSGNVESLKDLLSRMKTASDESGSSGLELGQRVTRTFLAAIHEAPEEALKVLLESGFVDIQSEDDINERNCLHQAAIYGKPFVLRYGLSKGVAADRTDVYGRVPLHYACMHGWLDMLDVLLEASEPTQDLKDHDNFTPLLHAIIHDRFACVEKLISRSARLDAATSTDHVPLNLACERGSQQVVELLLKHGAKIEPDAEGFYPQHLVARSVQNPNLLLLLRGYGADLDQIDKLYGWTPLVHAASEGNVPCLEALLQAGVDANILDEKGLPAVYYAAWEGHLACMKLLSPYNQRARTSPLMRQPNTQLGLTGSSSAPVPMSLDPDAIPPLDLPPPIIPLRRYGHNFLDKKTVVQLSFDETDEPAMVFFHDGKYPAARLTISSKVSDLIPKNIMLPFQEDTRLVSFQVDNLDTFTLDFDIFPTYGAKVIGKTVALPSTFRPGSSSANRCSLPLFDPRLRAIGQISFSSQVIKPFQGQPLEITDFETYWKATSQFEEHHTSTFVTGSSLTGDYVRLYVQHTSDGTPVLWPTWTIPCGALDIPISRLTIEQFDAVTRDSPARGDLASLPRRALDEIPEIHRILATAGVRLADALPLIPHGMHVNIHVLYPLPDDEARWNLGPARDLNLVADAVLSIVFDHARAQRAQSPDIVRSMVFSSYNANLCTALNWKQPNFPVFLCNELGRDEATAGTDVIQGSGRGAMSVKEAVRIATSNNLMGLICSSRLLDMVPALIDAIKSQGLALVTDMSDASAAATSFADPFFSRLPEGVDGVLKPYGVLRFTESIDI
ncbi:related to Nuc-2 protein [Cephalotrichum gorgonifer]|uniref:Related to Nuc-2 protein n=1 Tax=Cephalotrichum gorgonifer TaxID=2041049 RepID=A0AAE8N1V7_9PEZI|nr:related to Nuc-2 protein [Cephalotrichum gorgonifer]